MKFTLSTWFIRLDESQPLMLLRLQQQGSNVQPESRKEMVLIFIIVMLILTVNSILQYWFYVINIIILAAN